MTGWNRASDTDEAAAPSTRRAGLVRLGVVVALLLAIGVFGSWWALLVVVALIVMIFLHELGHFVMARRAGMKVTEFFLGFGPRVWSFRRGEVEYGIKAIPAGAYVRIIGMTNLEEVDPADEPRTYRQKSYWARLSVAVAGSAMHFLIALVLLFVTLGWFGVQRSSVWEIGSLTPDSPAAQAGLHVGDRIVAIDGNAVSTFADATSVIRARPGQPVVLTVKRLEGGTDTVEVTLAGENPQTHETVGFLGIGEARPYQRESLPAAVVGTFQEFERVARVSVVGLAKVFSPQGIRGYVDQLTDKQSSGSGSGDSRLVTIVGVPRLAAQAAHNGIADLLFLLAVVNISIGLFNLIPLLPFDGGHVAIATYEAVRSRPGRRYHADITKMLPVSYAVLGVFLLFFVTSLYLDIARPIGG
jgi:membrane-associated protease RseP (regulator of RpoE activity)